MNSILAHVRLNAVLLVMLLALTTIPFFAGWLAYRVATPAIEMYVTRYPEARAYCPGEKVEFGVHFQVRARGIQIVARTWYDVDKKLTAIPEKEPAWVVNSQPSISDRTNSVVVPELPAGNYEYRLATQGLNAGAEIITVPVLVGECD